MDSAPILIDSELSLSALWQGRLRCLGSSSHLKLRFGGGYLLEVHAADDDMAQARLAAYVARELGGEETEDRHFSRAKFRLPARGQVTNDTLMLLTPSVIYLHRFTGIGALILPALVRPAGAWNLILPWGRDRQDPLEHAVKSCAAFLESSIASRSHTGAMRSWKGLSLQK